MQRKLGIVAGGGDIPLMVAEACKEQGRPFSIILLDGIAKKEAFADMPYLSLKLGAAGTLVKHFRKEGVEDILFIGNLRRPSFKEIKFDWWSAKVVAKWGLNIFGDDNLLSLVIKAFEKEGFNVIGVQDVLQDILAKEGVYGRHLPDKEAKIDIKRGFEVAKGLGLYDVGQSVVVQQGMVIGVEAIEGTDALLKRTKDLQRSGKGGVLVKVKKPQQESRIDLPTVGLQTVENAYAAGLRGIAVEAGASLVVNPAEVIKRIDELNMFMVGLTSGEGFDDGK
ncbi:MAG: UDP-2,3-diacylglucosamine diphosphatase LpxI [Alphaproteobacteria bacterium]|nr:UDP-2,3-diacylglucosamine diphosphatase LpxI [Alphaproteobacteria bacterium]